MALSLDDKLLGEKTHYYCSSSEDEGEGSDNEGADAPRAEPQAPTFIPEDRLKDYDGSCTNVRFNLAAFLTSRCLCRFGRRSGTPGQALTLISGLVLFIVSMLSFCHLDNSLQKGKEFSCCFHITLK